jgi:DNA-binding transcriptional regulator YhcF (GntR family)
VPSTDLDQLDLDLVLDRDAEVPIGVQLAWALRARLRDGTLAPGQRLPGLRDLATALHINANTVRAVYQRLEHEGILVSRQGSGTFVSDAPTQAPSAAGAIAAQAARAALDTGVDPRDVAAALYVAPATVGSAAAAAAKPAARSAAGDGVAARRRQLRAQIAALQRTLGELEARHPALVPMPAEPTGAVSGPRLLDVGELEHVQAQLVSRLTALHAAIDKFAARAAAALPDDPPSPSTGSRKPQTAKTPRRTAAARARPAPAGA